MREKIIANGGDPDEFEILRDDKRPIIFRDVQWVWEGFMTLSGSRQMGYMSAQPIPLSEILFYLDHRGITDPDDRDEFTYLVQSLDRRFVAEQIAKSEARRKSQSPTPRKPPR